MNRPTLLLNLDTGKANTGLLQVGSRLAERLDANVIGIAARQPMQLDVSGMGYVPPEVFEEEAAETTAEMTAAEAEFRSVFQGNDVEWRSSVSFSPPADYIVNQARHADLLLIGTPVEKSDTTRATAGDLIMRCGRPVLVVPPAMSAAPLNRVMLAWKDTREARRAALDALPLLKHAASVSVVEIADDDEMAEARQRIDDVSIWLVSHGVAAEAKVVASRQDDSEQLCSLAHDLGADMIVAGAYGHSRLREWVFGGMTRTLLNGTERCTLLSR